MKGIDTNVLIRYLVQDDPLQSLYATHFIEKECKVENPGFINIIVLCEVVWILEAAYKYPKKLIADALEKIFRTRQFYIDQSEIVWRALRGYKYEGADFSDHLISHLNIHHGCEYTVTFDKKALQLDYFIEVKKEAELVSLT